MDGKPPALQDELLLSCFIIAAAAFLFTRRPQVLTSETAYAFTHPPQALRMTMLMNAVKTWCVQNRQALNDWLIAKPFQYLMSTVASAMWDMNGGARIWLPCSDASELLSRDAWRVAAKKGHRQRAV